MPVYLNEPISMLQRGAELFEHSHALSSAAKDPNRFKRLGYCIGFILMNLSQVIGRSKKPFNPLLGETFEIEDNGLRVICEQVSHHPPISAFYADHEDFWVQSFFEPKSKFTFTKMMVTPRVNIIIMLKKTKEKIFVPNFPSSTVHNLIRGDIYVWQFGTFEVLNLTTGDKAQVTLKSHPLFGSLDYTFTGKVCDSEGTQPLKHNP
jgi:hypothetical protein